MGEAMNIIGIAGRAGAGKDAAASVLVESFGFCRISLADEMKRICARIYWWGPGRLWGPSENRNRPDPSTGGLTARKALQHLGTEWGRAMYENTWINRALGDARQVLAGMTYDREVGVCANDAPVPAAHGVVIPDVRFRNEFDAIKAIGGRVWLVDRPGVGLTGEEALHASEAGLGDAPFDAIIRNTRGLDDFRADVALVAQMQLGK
jgi:hypothetical protein